MTQPIIDIWFFKYNSLPRDSFGRYRSVKGRTVLKSLSEKTPCLEGESFCETFILKDGRTFCKKCCSGWSVSHTENRAVIARAQSCVGVDLEYEKERDSAFQFFSKKTGVEIKSIEHWTQAEAVWKAMGRAKKFPEKRELILNTRWVYGWQETEQDWNIYTSTSDGFIWSLAVKERSEIQVHKQVC